MPGSPGSVSAIALILAFRQLPKKQTVKPEQVQLNQTSPDSPANVLTNAALDDFARIPEYKVCAVRVEKINE